MVARQHPKEGGCPLADFVGGLSVAGGLNWASTTRILYHVGDYPCHGTEFHNNLRDEYPRGDPYGLQPKVLLQQLISQGVQYYFGKLTDHTDKMINRFNQLVGETYINSIPMNETTVRN